MTRGSRFSQSDLALIAQIRADLTSGHARARREAAHLKPTEMAPTLGVTAHAIRLWEARPDRPSRRTPDAGHALGYAKILAAAEAAARPVAAA